MSGVGTEHKQKSVSEGSLESPESPGGESTVDHSLSSKDNPMTRDRDGAPLARERGV